MNRSLRPRPSAARALLALLAGLAVQACSPTPAPTTDVEGRALMPLPELDASVVYDTAAAGDTTSAPEVSPVTSAWRIAVMPEELQVYRSTRVALSAARDDGPSPEGATCRWSFGDGTPEQEGCAVEHTFIGGTADERVTLAVTVGGQTSTTTRILPLERLPVTAAKPIADLAVPAAPDGPSSFRAVIVADTEGLTGSAMASLVAQIGELSAHLVLHVGGVATKDGGAEAWTRLRDGLSEPLRAKGIPLLVAPSPADLEAGAEIRRPHGKDGDAIELIDGESFPERWAMSFRGVFFAFVSGADQDVPRGGTSGLAWLKARLAEAQIYESRVVVSHLPLHPFGERVPGGPAPHTLGPKFKVYELLLRARATALVSAGHAVYYKGRYGALPVLSVGSPAEGGRLLGSELTQAPSIVVMDVEAGVPTRIFALVAEGAGFTTVLDESYLPETVEVYTR